MTGESSFRCSRLGTVFLPLCGMLKAKSEKPPGPVPWQINRHPNPYLIGEFI
jgi:hypothetical protein